MSWRRKSWGSRRGGSGGSRRGGGRRMWLSADDDFQLSLVAMFTKSTPSRNKKSPARTRGRRRAATNAISTAPAEVITIEDTPESAKILSDVKSKVGTFMESGSFLSSDDDEVEVAKTKINKPPFVGICLSDDSDDDFNPIGAGSSSNFKLSGPSTSAATSSHSFKDDKLNNTADDIMEFVDSVISCTDKNEDKQNNLKDMKSLEDFRKETEEMLNNASNLLDEIKTGRKAEPEPAKEPETSPKVTVGSCPICLETLADRPASVTVCGHIFCKACIVQAATALKKCPTCRKPINAKKIHPIYF